MGLNGAGGRLIELGERERGAKLEAARALLTRDSDRSPEAFLSRGKVSRVALEQHFAADSMQFRFECAIVCSHHSLKRFVDGRNCAADIACARFGVGERNPYEPVEN
jgi:hypothetical protein